MKLRSIRLENVRRFVDPVEIADFGDGLNVLTAPNEHGKSTFFDALYAVFFKDRRSWDKEVRALVPYAGGDPQVMVDVELPEGVFRISKRWNSKRGGDVRITSAGQLIKQADDAEAWIADTLKSPKDGGPSGLLWVRQGQSDLREGADTHRARRDLMASVAGEVDAMTGGPIMETAREMCRTALERYLTAKGRVKTNSPLKHAEHDASALQTAREQLEGKCNDLRRELDRRRELRRELADLEDPEEENARKQRLAQAEAAFGKAERHHEALDRAGELERASRAEQERAVDRLTNLDSRLAELEAAQAAFTASQEDNERRQSEVRTADSAMSVASRAHKAALQDAEATADVLRRTLRAHASVAAADRRKELTEQLGRAEKLRQQTEQASANAKNEISDRCLTDIEGLEEDLRVMSKTRDLEAATVAMQYMDGRAGSVLLGGDALADRESIPIPDGAELDIERVGRLVIRPGNKAG